MWRGSCWASVWWPSGSRTSCGRPCRTRRAWGATGVCSGCGVKDGPEPLHVRKRICRHCGIVHDRDHTAAKNVESAAGLAVTACGAPVGPGLVLAQRGKAGSHGHPPESRTAQRHRAPPRRPEFSGFSPRSSSMRAPSVLHPRS
ncbi:zinc ribbon domain-containing protein [Streptomyces sp. NPDC058470]|uniref:zinc ribbon domain-containing protein n=1 Tax=Streptomyces sp. NPDC058470 TaxID=3346515 RepID=UPI00364E53E7